MPIPVMGIGITLGVSTAARIKVEGNRLLDAHTV